MAREDKIREAMQAAGVYSEAFEDSIKALAKAERQLSRSEKEWRKQGGQMVAELTNKTGATYTAKDPYWAVVETQRKDVQAMREKLGLTPSGLKKAQGRASGLDLGSKKSRIEELLDQAHEYALDHAGEMVWDVEQYVDGVLSGERIAGAEIRQACQRSEPVDQLIDLPVIQFQAAEERRVQLSRPGSLHVPRVRRDERLTFFVQGRGHRVKRLVPLLQGQRRQFSGRLPCLPGDLRYRHSLRPDLIVHPRQPPSCLSIADHFLVKIPQKTKKSNGCTVITEK